MEDTPIVSTFRLVLTTFGPSFIASHASASLSGAGLLVGISERDALSGLVTNTPVVEGRGLDEGITFTPSSE